MEQLPELPRNAVEGSCGPCTWEQSQWNYVKAPKVWASTQSMGIHRVFQGVGATTPVTTRWRSRTGQKL